MKGNFEYTCEVCGSPVRRFKFLKKVNNKFLCQKCYVENRKRHREETLNNSEDKERILEIKRELNRKSNLKRYVEKNGHLPRTYLPKKKMDLDSVPKLKGSIDKTKKKPNSLYLSLEEKQNLFRMLIKRGLSESECKSRIDNLVKEQRRVKEYLKFKNRPEAEIKKMQVKLMDNLLR